MKRFRWGQAEQRLPLFDERPGTGPAALVGVGEGSATVLLRFQEQLPDPHLRFMQLRFRVSRRATEESCDLLVLIALYFMQEENRPVTFRQLADRLNKGDTVNGASEPAVPGPEFAPDRLGIGILGGSLIQMRVQRMTSCGSASALYLPQSDAARWRARSHHEMWTTCGRLARRPLG